MQVFVVSAFYWSNESRRKGFHPRREIDAASTLRLCPALTLVTRETHRGLHLKCEVFSRQKLSIDRTILLVERITPKGFSRQTRQIDATRTAVTLLDTPPASRHEPTHKSTKMRRVGFHMKWEALACLCVPLTERIQPQEFRQIRPIDAASTFDVTLHLRPELALVAS